MCYVFSLRVFKQMGAHTHAHQASPAFIHSLKHSLAVKIKMFSHNQILINPKNDGLVHVYMCTCLCQEHIWKAGMRFGRLEYTLLEFIIVIIILTHVA